MTTTAGKEKTMPRFSWDLKGVCLSEEEFKVAKGPGELEIMLSLFEHRKWVRFEDFSERKYPLSKVEFAERRRGAQIYIGFICWRRHMPEAFEGWYNLKKRKGTFRKVEAPFDEIEKLKTNSNITFPV